MVLRIFGFLVRAEQRLVARSPRPNPSRVPQCPGQRRPDVFLSVRAEIPVFFVLPVLLPAWLLVFSLKFLMRRRGLKALIIYSLLMALGWSAEIYLFGQAVSLPWATAAAYLTRSIFAPVFLQLAVFNHLGLHKPEEPLP